MDFDHLNRWLTLGANIGVLFGIILLVIELNQNRDMIRAQTRSELSQGELMVLGSIAGDKEQTDILVRVNQGEEVGKVILGTSPIFNTGGGFIVPLTDDETYISGVFGPVRFSRKAE